MAESDELGREPGWNVKRQDRLKALGVSRPQLLELIAAIAIIEPPPSTNPIPVDDVRREIERLNSGLLQAAKVLERAVGAEQQLRALEPDWLSIIPEDDEAPLAASAEVAVEEFYRSPVRRSAAHEVAKLLRSPPAPGDPESEAWGGIDERLHLSNLYPTIAAAQTLTASLLTHLETQPQWRQETPHHWVRDVDRALKQGFVRSLSKAEVNISVSTAEAFEIFYKNKKNYEFNVSAAPKSSFHAVCRVCRRVIYGGPDQECSRAIRKYRSDIKARRGSLFPIPVDVERQPPTIVALPPHI